MVHEVDRLMIRACKKRQRMQVGSFDPSNYYTTQRRRPKAQKRAKGHIYHKKNPYLSLLRNTPKQTLVNTKSSPFIKGLRRILHRLSVWGKGEKFLLWKNSGAASIFIFTEIEAVEVAMIGIRDSTRYINLENMLYKYG